LVEKETIPFVYLCS